MNEWHIQSGMWMRGWELIFSLVPKRGGKNEKGEKFFLSCIPQVMKNFSSSSHFHLDIIRIIVLKFIICDHKTHGKSFGATTIVTFKTQNDFSWII